MDTASKFQQMYCLKLFKEYQCIFFKFAKNEQQQTTHLIRVAYSKFFSTPKSFMFYKWFGE